MISINFLNNIYSCILEKKIYGRWIKIKDIEPLFNNLNNTFKITRLGFSENNNPIYQLKIGAGNKKILIWSQMHGNESTGTKAIFDFLNFIKNQSKNKITKSILENCVIKIVPMLNPDGAQFYTRLNTRGIDLNRDAVDLNAKESNILRSLLDDFKPDFCFNLHDQRSIFGAGNTNNPATISFLSPSEEKTRKLTKGRIETMDVIVSMNNLLQKVIPNHIGRYTDEFYPTATGDNFQKMGFNTILIEAGHYPNDYNREITRKYNFYCLLEGIYYISKNNNFKNYMNYFNIPENNKIFFDVIHRSKNKKDVAFLYKEEIINNIFALSLKKVKEGDLSYYLAHKDLFI